MKIKKVWGLRGKVECFRRTGKPPVTVRWVDVNEGDDMRVNYRARLVARQMKKQAAECIFAPTLPLEAIRNVIRLASTDIKHQWYVDWKPESKKRTSILMIDISRAYFNAKTGKVGQHMLPCPKSILSTEGKLAYCCSTCTARLGRLMGGKQNIAAR